jgi:hypothetical protein
MLMSGAKPNGAGRNSSLLRLRFPDGSACHSNGTANSDQISSEHSSDQIKNPPLESPFVTRIIAQAIGHAVIQQGYRVLYREAHALLEELADATLDGNRKQHMELLTTVPCSSSTTSACASCSAIAPRVFSSICS